MSRYARAWRPAGWLIKSAMASSAVIALAGCSNAAAEEATVGTPNTNAEPMVVQMHAAYPGFSDLDSLLEESAAVVQGSIISSRVVELYPDVSTSDDPRINPQAGLTPEQIAEGNEIPPLVATVFTMQVENSIEGSPANQIEIRQLGGTKDGVTYLPPGDASLEVDPAKDYVLILAKEGENPYVLPNPAESAYIVDAQDKLTPVDPGENTVGVPSIEALESAVSS